MTVKYGSRSLNPAKASGLGGETRLEVACLSLESFGELEMHLVPESHAKPAC